MDSYVPPVRKWVTNIMAIIRIPYIIGLSAVLLLSTAYLGITYHDIHEQDFINDLENKDEKAALADLRRGVNPNTREPLPDPRNFSYWLEEHLKPHSLRYEQGHTALNLAIIRGNSQRVLRALLDAGANPNADDPGGVTPLMTAANKGDVATLQLLLDYHADINLEDIQHQNALGYAAEGNHVRAARLLLEHHANPHAKGIGAWLTNMLQSQNRFAQFAKRRQRRKPPEILRVLQEARAKP